MLLRNLQRSIAGATIGNNHFAMNMLLACDISQQGMDTRGFVQSRDEDRQQRHFALYASQNGAAQPLMPSGINVRDA